VSHTTGNGCGWVTGKPVQESAFSLTKRLSRRRLAGFLPAQEAKGGLSDLLAERMTL